MKEKISAFWKWFVENEHLIKESIEDEQSLDRGFVVDQLNELVLDMGTFTWDIGLDDSNSWFLTISPNGNKKLLKVSEKIMRSAPEYSAWIFHASKPAKDWDRKYSVYNDAMDEEYIDASAWEYIAFDEDDGRVELIFEAKNIAHLDEDTADTAANTFVLNEIGEYAKIQRISTVTIVGALEDEYANSKTAVRHLRRDLGV